MYTGLILHTLFVYYTYNRCVELRPIRAHTSSLTRATARVWSDKKWKRKGFFFPRFFFFSFFLFLFLDKVGDFHLSPFVRQAINNLWTISNKRNKTTKSLSLIHSFFLKYSCYDFFFFSLFSSSLFFSSTLGTYQFQTHSSNNKRKSLGRQFLV